jgi:hypothetical protein
MAIPLPRPAIEIKDGDMHSSQHFRPADGGTILKQELLQLANREQLRLRAFGETVIYGLHKPFDGNRDLALRALSRMLDDGLVAVYRDEDGLFVGPSNPALIESEEVDHGL